MSLEVKIIPGQLPLFWGKSAVYFMNLHALFFGNDELTKVLEGEICGMPTYGGRVVSILDLIFRDKKNLVILEAPPDESLLEYLSSKLGLSIPDIEILPFKNYGMIKERITNDEIEPVIEKIRNHSAEWIDGCATDETLTAIAKNTKKSTISSFEGSKKGNNKLLLHNYLEEKGLPVFDTFLASSAEEVISCFDKLCKIGYGEAVLKSQIGASGCGLVKHYTAFNPPQNEFPDYFFFEGPCLVQGWLDEKVKEVKHIGSPSVQMFLSDTALSLFDVTEQFLSDRHVHEGNISPPPYFKEYPQIKEEMLSQAEVAGRWLHEQGYRGTGGVDFLTVKRNGKVEVIVNEINARVTGATYPSVLARHFLPHKAWIMRNLKFDSAVQGHQLLTKLDRNGLLFKKDMERGILPFNFNQDVSGNVSKGQFLFLASDTEECKNLLEKIQNLFPSICKFDRD
tara:strand:- start:3336 stop:4694 length:1359 start_codon:yes stop_codon:yes gene_type:complete